MTKSQTRLRRLATHLRRAPWDMCARKAMETAMPTWLMPPLVKSPSETRAEQGVTLTELKRSGSLRDWQSLHGFAVEG